MTPVLATGAAALEVGLSLTTGLILLALFGASFFFSGSETALFSLQKLDRHDLAQQGPSGSAVTRLLARGRRPLMSTILVGNETANVALIVVAAGVIAAADLHPALNLLLLTPVLILVSDVTPKGIALRQPRRWAKAAAWPLTLLYWLLTLTGIRLLFTVTVDGIARLFGAAAEVQDRGPTEQELMVIMDRGAEAGTVDPVERDIIEAVFEFDDLTVDRLMTPRPDMLTLPLDIAWDELMQTCRSGAFSRIPIHGDRPDDIVGVLLVKDLLRHRVAPPAGPRQLRSLLLPPTFVPASKAADDMLETCLTRRLHMAFVVDEHGSLVGLITLDDLLDELIGDELDESSEERDVSRIRPDAITVKAGMDIEDFIEETQIEVPRGDWHTIGGFVFHQLGRLPRTGDSVHWASWTFLIVEMEGRRITGLEVVERDAPPAAEEVG